MVITNIYFTKNHIHGVDENGKIWSQSLLWYPRLKNASDAQRADYTIGLDGFHWRNVDEDISFESFFYEDAEPSPLQRFFLTHKEISIPDFARKIGINSSLLNNFINGFKKPSEECEKMILNGIQNYVTHLQAT